MRKLLLTSAVAAISASGAFAASHSDGIKVGVLLAYTGPIEAMVAEMGPAAELAISEVSDSGKFMDGMTVTAVTADSKCDDAGIATAAAERLITSDGVKGIVGAACSGMTGAVLANVAIPNGMVMISPSATSPGLSTVDDGGLFFRTAPSDARQGAVMADILLDQDITEVAVTYQNSDYGKGLADAFEAAYTKAGGTVTINASHEDNKADYSAEVGALAAAGGQRLVVAGYANAGGSGIVRAALDTGAFDTFHFPDGMISTDLEDNFGTEIEGSTGQNPGSDNPGSAKFAEIAGDSFNPTGTFAPESYDAAALILLAMQAAGSVEPADYKETIMNVANAPGEKIYPGELGKALDILKDGGDIDYVGASAVELIEPGESAGNYREVVIKDGKLSTVGYR